MNPRLKIAGLFLVGIGLFAFTYRAGTPITVNSIRETLLMTLFTDYEPADTTISITVKNYFGNDVDGKLHPASLCAISPSFMPSTFRYAVDTSYEGFEAGVRARMISLFGADVIKGKLKIPGKDYEGNPMFIYQYSGVGVQAVFNKLYQKPTATFKGIGLQKLYNVSSKQYLRDATDIIIAIMAKKPIWDAEVKRYLQQVTTKEDFYMGDFAGETYTKIFGEKEMPECAPYANQMIGSMLRRGGDGSLPTLILTLKTVLKDYDPEYYNKVALKF
jgi:hypothetical protein